MDDRELEARFVRLQDAIDHILVLLTQSKEEETEEDGKEEEFKEFGEEEKNQVYKQ